MTLTCALADRVRRLMPLLASSHDGETIASRDAISRALHAGGRDWHDLAASITGVDHPPPTPAFEMPFAFGDLARACRDLDGGRLTPRERAFVQQMCALGFVRQPTAKQHSWMREIFKRLSARAAA